MFDVFFVIFVKVPLRADGKKWPRSALLFFWDMSFV